LLDRQGDPLEKIHRYYYYYNYYYRLSNALHSSIGQNLKSPDTFTGSIQNYGAVK